MEIPDTPRRFDLCVKISCEGLRDRWRGKQGRLCSRWSLFAHSPAVCPVPLPLAPPGPATAGTGCKCAWADAPSMDQPALLSQVSPCVGSGSELRIGIQKYNWSHFTEYPFLSSHILLYGKSKTESKCWVHPCLFARGPAPYQLSVYRKD